MTKSYKVGQYIYPCYIETAAFVSEEEPPVIRSQSWTRSRRSLPISSSKEQLYNVGNKHGMEDVCPAAVQALTPRGDCSTILKKVDGNNSDMCEAKSDSKMMAYEHDEYNTFTIDDRKTRVNRGYSFDTSMGNARTKKSRLENFGSSWRQDENSQEAVKRKMSSDCFSKGIKMGKFGSSTRQVVSKFLCF